MTVSAISHYRGGTIDVVTPVAKKLKAAYLKHGIAYRLSRFETGPNVGDWFVVVQFADQTAYDKAHAAIAQDPEIRLCRDCKVGDAEAESWSSISIFENNVQPLQHHHQPSRDHRTVPRRQPLCRQPRADAGSVSRLPGSDGLQTLRPGAS
jgi:hypothetical protein